MRPLFFAIYMHKKTRNLFIYGFLRSRADSNRCRRFCRPLPNRSATRPERIAKLAKFLLNQTFLMLSSIIIATFSTSPFIGGQIFVIFTLINLIRQYIIIIVCDTIFWVIRSISKKQQILRFCRRI